MLEVKKSDLFEKDIKILSKKHYKFNKLFLVTELLQKQNILPDKYKNHYLQGNWKGYQECHIEKDLLLIYYIKDNSILILYRLSTHKDLFGI